MTEDDSSLIGIFVVMFISVIILLAVLGGLIPELENAGDQLNQTNQCNTLSGCLFNITNSSTSPCRLEINQTFVCDAGTGEVPLSNLFRLSIIGLFVMGVVIIFIAGSIAIRIKSR